MADGKMLRQIAGQSVESTRSALIGAELRSARFANFNGAEQGPAIWRKSLADVAYLKQLEQRLLWLSSWTVHNANHLRAKDEGDVKVGGHQASCASIVSIMTALYFRTLRSEAGSR